MNIKFHSLNNEHQRNASSCWEQVVEEEGRVYNKASE